jgi:hypothetical protein
MVGESGLRGAAVARIARMAKTYQLPCACGELHPVEAAQAGETLTCQCGRSVEVPSLLGLKKLQPLAETGKRAAGRPAGRWTLGQGLLFAAGIVVCLCAVGLSAYWMDVRSKLLQVPVMEDDSLPIQLERISKLTPEQSWQVWADIRDQSLGVRLPPPHVLARKAAAGMRLQIQVALGVALLGAAMSLLPVILRRRN